MKAQRFLSILLFAFFFCLKSFAQTTPPAPAFTPQFPLLDALHITTTFDPVQANKTLSQLTTLLKGNNLNQNFKDLQDAISAINKFQIQAKRCIETNTLEMNKVNHRLNEIIPAAPSPGNKNQIGVTAEQKYLTQKKYQLENQSSECSLFLLHLDDINTAAADKLHQLVATRLSFAFSPIWQNLKNLPISIIQLTRTFNTDVFMPESGILFFIQSNPFIAISPFLIIAGIFYVHRRWKNPFKSIIGTKAKSSFLAKIKQAFFVILQHYLLSLGIAVTFALYFSLFTHSLVTPSYLALISYAFLGYTVFLALLRLLFFPPAPAHKWVDLPHPISSVIVKRLRSMGLIALFAYGLYVVFQKQAVEHSLIGFYHTTILALFVYNLGALVLIFKKKSPQSALRTFLVNLFLFLLTAIGIIECLGYHLLAGYLLYGIVRTLIALLVARLVIKSVQVGLDAIMEANHPWQQDLREIFGLKKKDRLLELLWLNIVCYVVVWTGFLVVLFKIWEWGQTYFETLLNHLLYGVYIGGVRVVPSRILAGALFFIILSLGTRWLRTYIIKRSNWRLENSSKESLGSIAGYVGFTFAFLFGALFAGLQFSGLVIIAGGLSVGIGFGLQMIVGNFVSGIILLIERPFRLGDRVVVGETEGYVKKISIRSTHIRTTRHSDVIVPNSEFVSKQVTNYMLHNLNYRASTTVYVSYGNDPEKVKAVLLEIAQSHPKVITNKPGMEPAVNLTKLTESSLQFDLYCSIEDINMNSTVVSDLNFAIQKRFREENIEMRGSSQQDIRITQWPESALIQKNEL